MSDSEFSELKRHGTKTPRDHMSRQFTYVIHNSVSPTPVHKVPDLAYPHRYDEYSNKHPSSFHAGTPRAARSITEYAPQSYSHIYKIDRNVIDPLMWGDDMHVDEQFNDRVKDIPPMLTESVSIKAPMIAANANSKAPRALPYRNVYEDKGSTSFVIPKNLVGRGVTYLGTTTTGEDK